MATEIDPYTYEFDFGRYRGYTYAFVLRYDPAYIEWCLKQERGFALNEADIAILSDALSAKLPSWLK